MNCSKRTAKNDYDIIIIGGGAAGMAAALSCSDYLKDPDRRVLLLEKKDRVGSKIPATGNGRCNLSNEYMDACCFHSEDPERVAQIMASYDLTYIRSFFKRAGIVTKSINGYIYPYNEQASSVRKLLETALMIIPALTVLTGTKAVSVRPDPDRGYRIATTGRTFYGRKVILTTGGYAGPAFGCSGDGYDMAKDLGLHLIKPLPALTALISGAPFLKKLQGVRCHARITLFINDCEAASDEGQLQWTDYGVSGVVVFQISRFAVAALENNDRVYLSIDLMPDYSDRELKELIRNSAAAPAGGGSAPAHVLEGILHSKLVPVILRESKQDKYEGDVCGLSEDQLDRLADAVKRFRLIIRDYVGYEKAQVTRGGVSLKELDGSLQSLRYPGLYIAGELADVDGICGGYNLSWAWSSGSAAGIAAASSLGKD